MNKTPGLVAPPSPVQAGLNQIKEIFFVRQYFTQKMGCGTKL